MCERSESARRGEYGKGSCALSNRDRALAAENVAGISQPDRPTRRQRIRRPGERLMAQLPGDCDSVGLCSATLPLCAQLRGANSAQIREEAAMSENAEQKKRAEINQFSANSCVPTEKR